MPVSKYPANQPPIEHLRNEDSAAGSGALDAILDGRLSRRCDPPLSESDVRRLRARVLRLVELIVVRSERAAKSGEIGGTGGSAVRVGDGKSLPHHDKGAVGVEQELGEINK